LIQTTYALAAVVIVFCVYSLITPKPIFESVRRALLADLAPPTNTRLQNIKPGENESLNKVVAGTHVPFSVELQGVRPQRVVLHYSVDGGQFYSAKDLARGTNDYDPWTLMIRNVQQSMDYYLTAGDARSKEYRLTVLPAPMVVSV